jgi:hypothetical protein
MFNPRQPLWLPAGSVRALLALLVTFPFLVLALSSGVKITSEQFITILTIVLGFYFISKAVNGGAK